jgi:hypothetical protein
LIALERSVAQLRDTCRDVTAISDDDREIKTRLIQKPNDAEVRRHEP